MRLEKTFLKVRLDPEKRRVRAVDSWIEESSQVDPKRILRLQVDLDRSENDEKNFVLGSSWEKIYLCSEY